MSEPGPGHNQGGIDQRLTSLVQRIERLNGEKAELASDLKDVYAESKSAGYDCKVLRALIAKRKRDAAELAEHEALLATYEAALGMLADTPLGAAAMEHA
jgi:uncharacterized protein (UPF0335 family)